MQPFGCVSALIHSVCCLLALRSLWLLLVGKYAMTLCDLTFSCGTKPWLWLLLFNPLLPSFCIPLCFHVYHPSLPVGQSEERSDGSSSGSGTGPGESSIFAESESSIKGVAIFRNVWKLWCCIMKPYRDNTGAWNIFMVVTFRLF